MDDGALYTGNDGVFGNEITEESVQEKLDKQKAALQALTPQLESIVAMLKAEQAGVIQDIADFIDRSMESESVNSAEIKAAARYRKYVGTLLTKFEHALSEVKK